MIQSMTGFGKSEVDFPGKRITIEIKSLNSKQLDVNTRIPTAYREKDIEIRNILSQGVERGKVDCIITLDTVDKSGSNAINQTVVKNYYEEIKDLSDKLNIALPSEWFSIILRLPEAIKTEMTKLDEKEWEAVKQAIEKAIHSLNEFRKQEGLMLETVFIDKIDKPSKLVFTFSVRFDTIRRVVGCARRVLVICHPPITEHKDGNSTLLQQADCVVNGAVFDHCRRTIVVSRFRWNGARHPSERRADLLGQPRCLSRCATQR